MGGDKQEFVLNEKNIKSQNKFSLLGCVTSKSYTTVHLTNTIVGRKYFQDLVLTQEEI
jgi:hypothetical protein